MRRQIYSTLNNINGRRYIGQASGQDIRKGYLGSGLIIKKAIKKYSINNFTKEILFDDDANKELIDFIEVECIEHYKTLVCHGGYNIAVGGMGNSGQLGRKASSETKKKISDARMGMKFSDEHKLNLAEAKIGTIQSQEHIIHRAIGATGKVISIDGVLYGTQGIASEALGVSVRTIGRRLKNEKCPNVFHVDYNNQDSIIGLSSCN